MWFSGGFRAFPPYDRAGARLRVYFGGVDQGPVDDGVALYSKLDFQGWYALDHGNKDDVIGGIDPEPGAGGAIPEEGAIAFGQVGLRRVVDNRAIVALAEAGTHDLISRCHIRR